MAVSVTAVAVHAYDGNSDPVISLSYLKQYIQTMVDPQIQTMQQKIAALRRNWMLCAIRKLLPIRKMP